jgi:heterotetrameric sarcosine oxidase gamma subunit
MRVSAPDIPTIDGVAGVLLRAAHADIVEIAPFRERATEVRSLAAQRGWRLPEMGQVLHSPEGLALCVRPQRWLLLSAQRPVGAAQAAWRNAIADRAAVLDASSALCALHLSGKAWRSMLARGSRIDLDPQRFASGSAAATLIAQVSVILAVLGESLLLLTPATTARHLREWLHSTSRPFRGEAPPGATVELFGGEMRL